jgi:hypothetical protein
LNTFFQRKLGFEIQLELTDGKLQHSVAVVAIAEISVSAIRSRILFFRVSDGNFLLSFGLIDLSLSVSGSFLVLMGSYSVQIIGSSSVQIRPFPLEISSVVAMQVHSSTVSRPPRGSTKLCSLHKSRPSNSHRKKLASKTVVAALHDHLYLKRATIAQGFPTFTASQVASQQNLDPSCGVQPEQQSGMMAHGIQSPEELREQLEALQKECKDVWAQGNETLDMAFHDPCL